MRDDREVEGTIVAKAWEWDRISDLAEAAGLMESDYMVARALGEPLMKRRSLPSRPGARPAGKETR